MPGTVSIVIKVSRVFISPFEVRITTDLAEHSSFTWHQYEKKVSITPSGMLEHVVILKKSWLLQTMLRITRNIPNIAWKFRRNINITYNEWILHAVSIFHIGFMTQHIYYRTTNSYFSTQETLRHILK